MDGQTDRQTDGQTDVGHINLIGGLVTRNPPKNSIRDARTPQSGEIVFNTMRYRSSETVQRSGYFQSSVSYIKLQIMYKYRKLDWANSAPTYPQTGHHSCHRF